MVVALDAELADCGRCQDWWYTSCDDDIDDDIGRVLEGQFSRVVSRMMDDEKTDDASSWSATRARMGAVCGRGFLPDTWVMQDLMIAGIGMIK